MLKKIDRIHCQPHVGLAGKLLPNPASRFGGRATANRMSLDDDHIATPTPGQVIGNATANDSTSNNQNIRRSGKCLSLFTHSCVSITSCFFLSTGEEGKPVLISFLNL
jgi:hypothetical protein